jgi:ABC-type cobalt transport system, periplasmic component
MNHGSTLSGEPPSGEIESLLFALQAAIGAIIIGYILGYFQGQAKERKRIQKKIKPEFEGDMITKTEIKIGKGKCRSPVQTHLK